MSNDGAILAPDGTVLFSERELACTMTHKIRLHDGFAEKLRELRLAYGKPMKVTSCCRSAEHNRMVGGAANSLHIWDQPAYEGQTGTLAIDIACPDASERWELAHLAMSLQWSVGVPQKGRNFIHLDQRAALGLPRVLFGY